MRIEGGCHCRAISFTAEIDPAQVMICHCADCQVLSGAPFRAIVAAPVASFRLRGEPKRYVKVAESGNPRAQVFCPDCATPLFSTALDSPTHVTLRVGCIEQRAELVPRLQLWQRSAVPWLHELETMAGVAAQLPAPAATPIAPVLPAPPA